MPFVVGIGGTTRKGSTTEAALQYALRVTEARGARTIRFGAEALAGLGSYDPVLSVEGHVATAREEYFRAIRRADGVIIASPGYHGSVSGLVKNGLDLLEELRDDRRPYLSDRSVGCISCAYGWQAAVSTLASLRTIAHALRGWPTPLGVALNTAELAFTPNGDCDNSHAQAHLTIIAEQVVWLAALVARRSRVCDGAVA